MWVCVCVSPSLSLSKNAQKKSSIPEPNGAMSRWQAQPMKHNEYRKKKKVLSFSLSAKLCFIKAICHPIKHIFLTRENAQRTRVAVKSQSNGSKSASPSIYCQASASGCFSVCCHLLWFQEICTHQNFKQQDHASQACEKHLDSTMLSQQEQALQANH